MTNDKLMANQRNALLSTGPRTAVGKTRSAGNAQVHGLYSAAVVPALGETHAALADLCTAVRAVLRPEGVLEERLCDRVALLLLRLDRVTRFEAATAARDTAAVAGDFVDPDTVTGDGVDVCRTPHPSAPPAVRLAYARARLSGWEPVRDAFRAAAAALGGADGLDAVVAAAESRWVVYEVGAAFGWGREETFGQWTAAVAGVADEPIPGGRFSDAVRELARNAGRDPAEAVAAVRDCLAARAAEYDGPIAEKEAALAAELRAARERAAAVAVYADEKAVETVVRLEAHLVRQLGLTLDLLGRLKGDRSDSGGGLEGLLRDLAARPKGPLVIDRGGFVS